MKKLFLTLIISYLSVISIGFIFIYSVHCIPYDIIKHNVEESIEIINHEGIDYRLFSFGTVIDSSHMFAQDGITDLTMLSETHNVGYKNAMSNSLLNYQISNEPYGRYWHGYLVTLVPALTIMNLHEIRTLNYFLFGIIILAICCLAYRKISKSVPAIFLMVLFSCGFFVVPYSLQFSTVFYIAFCASLMVILFNSVFLNITLRITFFFLIGCITSYGDFLTAPIVTLGFPMIFSILSIEHHLKNKWREVIVLSCSWILGYAMMWGAKWVLAYLITGINIISDGINQACLRMGNDIPHYNKLIPGIFVILVLVCLFSLLFRKSWKVVKENLWLILIALIPIVWFLLLKQHTAVHYGFAWRNLFVSIFAVLLFILRIIKLNFYSDTK